MMLKRIARKKGLEQVIRIHANTKRSGDKVYAYRNDIA